MGEGGKRHCDMGNKRHTSHTGMPRFKSWLRFSFQPRKQQVMVMAQVLGSLSPVGDLDGAQGFWLLSRLARPLQVFMGVNQ